MFKKIYFYPSNEIFGKFDGYEISPCLIVGRDDVGEIIYEACNSYDPNIVIWCVYGHFSTGGRECISDHYKLADAEVFERTLPLLDSIK